jgi:hypothetical protein
MSPRICRAVLFVFVLLFASVGVDAELAALNQRKVPGSWKMMMENALAIPS